MTTTINATTLELRPAASLPTSGRFKDITGQTFGRLTVVSFAGTKNTRAYWNCDCSCGNQAVVVTKSLNSGYVISCGCLPRQKKAPETFDDLTGQQFGRLTAVSQGDTLAGHITWNCTCECGSFAENIRACYLKSGNKRSCGCLRTEVHTSHGHGGTYINSAWHSMIARCHDPENAAFKDYGGRGITVCEGWSNGRNGLYGVQAFFEDMGHRPTKGHSLDRADNNKGYWCGHADCPECGPLGRTLNCRWATRSVQNFNKRPKLPVVVNGVTMNWREAAEALGITISGVQFRYNRFGPDLGLHIQPLKRQPKRGPRKKKD